MKPDRRRARDRHPGVDRLAARGMAALLLLLPAGCGTPAGASDADEGLDGEGDAGRGAAEDAVADREDADADRAGDAETPDVRGDWTPPDYGDPPPSTCGNGTLDPGEECDDGNRMNGDGCDWRCLPGDGEVVDVPPDPAAGRLSAEPAVSWLSPSIPVASPFMASVRIPVVATGAAYSLVWSYAVSDGTDGESRYPARFLRLDTSGRPFGAQWEFDFDASWKVMALAWTGSGFGLAITGSRETTVRLMLLDAEGKPTSEAMVVGQAPLGGMSVAIAWDGVGFAVLWNYLYGDPADAEMGLQFVRVGPDGSTRGGDAVVLVERGVDHVPVSLARSGSSYLATWQGPDPDGERGLVRYALLDDEGAVSVGPRTLGASLIAPHDAVWAGDRFAVVWVAPVPEGDVLHVARFDADGALLGPPTASRSGRPVSIQVLAFAGAAGARSVAAAWVEHVTDVNLVLSRFDLEGTFIEETILPAFSLPGLPISLNGQIGMAFDGSGFGVVCTAGWDPLLIRREVVW